jgi:hypothetical protein
VKKLNLGRWVIGFLLALAGGCGYTTHAYVAQTGHKSIYVEPFLNKIDTVSEYGEGSRFKTYFPLTENKITNAVVNRFIFDGNLKVTSEKNADLVLQGDLIKYHREVLRYAAGDNPLQYRVTLYVNLKLVEAKTQKVVWEKKEFAGDSTYFNTGQFVISESQSVDDAAKDLARRIVDLTVEAW